MMYRIPRFLVVLIALPFMSYAHYTIQQQQKNQLTLNQIEQVGKVWVTEGDILVSTREKENRGAIVIKTAGGTRWPKGILPFYIDKSMPTLSREHIYQAMIQISLQTPVRFKEVDAAHPPQDYVHFTPSESGVCASHVGRKGGGQQILLASRCQKASIMHEIFHALGFWHEQSRADRDNYIQIHWENISEGKQHNFFKHVGDSIDVDEYDYDSIMHYGPKAFSKNGQNTIVPLVNGKVIGQRYKLSERDIKAMGQLYTNEAYQ